MAKGEPCLLDGCEMPQLCRGVCHRHYHIFRRMGLAMPLPPVGPRGPYLNRKPGLAETFFAKAVQSESSECIPWPFECDRDGYGRLRFRSRRGSLAHRAACIERYGPPPFTDACAAHSCGNRQCINPSHLRWATRFENNQDLVIHGTRAVGERCASAKLTEAQVRAIRQDARTHRQVAEAYGVSKHAIEDIRRRQTWKHVA